MDGGTWWAAVHGVAKSRTRLSDFTFTFHFHELEKEMETQSGVLAWRIPGIGEPGGLPSMGSHRVGHDWSDLAAAAAEKAREFQKNIYFCFTDYAKAFDGVDHDKLWKILQETGIPDHLTCLLRNLYAGQEATVRTIHGTTNWFWIGKRVHQGSILSPCLFNLYVEYIMRNAGLEEAQAGIKIARRNINISDMQMTPPLWQKVKRD